MLFDFLKRLFWRANEGGGKRKVNDNDEIGALMQSKRYRHGKSFCKSISVDSDAWSTHGSKGKGLTENTTAANFTKSLNNWNHQTKLISSKNLDIISGIPHEYKDDIFIKNGKFDHPAHEITDFVSKAQGNMHQSMLLKMQEVDETINYENMMQTEAGTNEASPCCLHQQPNVSVMNPFSDSHGPSLKTFYSAVHKGSDQGILCSPAPSSFRFKCDEDVHPLNAIGPRGMTLPKQTETCSSPRRNTLKDKLLSRDVTKHDFILQIARRYESREMQCYKELDELHRMTDILSKHNQSLRESVLEDCLNRSLVMIEAVLDEQDDQEILNLPELSPEMMKQIHNALANGHEDEVLSQKYGLRITRKDIQTLAGLNWLNDEVINFYMNLLITRGENNDFPSVYAMNTFFYPKLISGGHASLRRWTRKIDIFSKDIIVVPIHLGIHWCMSIIDFRYKSIQYYDSMGSPNNKCLHLLRQYIYEESMDKKKEPFNFQDWNFECVQDIPRQMNGSDCGVFSCVFAEYVCSNQNFNFSQDDMPYFRNKMIYEILTAKLL